MYVCFKDPTEIAVTIVCVLLERCSRTEYNQFLFAEVTYLIFQCLLAHKQRARSPFNNTHIWIMCKGHKGGNNTRTHCFSTCAEFIVCVRESEQCMYIIWG